ncbi:hypothetical protein ACFQL1_03815 [Halomicroarcula sp. GCM10025709]|uniref:DUF7269 family protein n=1 Tax=Haloarcula TaxID=2237 RepID=UPI0024C379E6|nr:hypothetical protein [Halomicroarcula sp. YJ-61-S]
MSQTKTVEPADEKLAVDTETVERADEQANQRRADADTDDATAARASVDATIEREPAGRLWLVFAFAGLAALAAAAVVATFPGLVETVAAADAVRQLRGAAPLLGAVVGALGLYGLYDRHESPEYASDETVELPAANPESTQGTEQTVVGADIDELLESIDGRVDPYNGLEASYAADIRRELRETAKRVIVDSTGVPDATAAAAIDEGTWTDDQRAASFLGNETVAEPSLGVQLRDWASGEAFDRRVNATLDAIRRVERGDLR